MKGRTANWGTEYEEGAEPEQWDVPVWLRARMTEVARQFRKEPTPSEAILWRALRRKQLEGRRFRRQRPIGPFVVDFYCASERLIVEVDGPIHGSQVEADRERQELLESLGLRFVRVAAAAVEDNLPSVLGAIRKAFGPLSPNPFPPQGGKGEGAMASIVLVGL